MTDNLPDKPDSEIVIYQAEDGRGRIEVRLQDETAWLTQNLLAELYQTSKQNISHHIKSIYEEGELAPRATVKKYLTVRQEGSRTVRRPIDHYSLDMIIAVGYRVKSTVATRFRQWATARLREYIVKGWEILVPSLPGTGHQRSVQSCRNGDHPIRAGQVLARQRPVSHSVARRAVRNHVLAARRAAGA